MAQLPDDSIRSESAGQKALTDALRLSFSVLRLAMLAMLGVFLLSGFVRIKEGEVAVRTRLGRIVGEPGQQVLLPGGPYFAMPSPIDQVIRIPVTLQRTSLDKGFWFEPSQANAGKRLEEMSPQGDSLVPGKDGSLLTASNNLLHARFGIVWQVRRDRATDYLANVGTMAQAQRLVQAAVERSVVEVFAVSQADDLNRGQVPTDQIRSSAQRELDSLGSGLAIADVLSVQITPPLACLKAFAQVNEAESDKTQKIEAARRDRSRVMNEAAGAPSDVIASLLSLHDRVLAESPQKAQSLLAALNGVLDGASPTEALKGLPAESWNDELKLVLADERARLPLGGRASQVVSDAKAYKTQVVAQVKSESDKFLALLPAYQAQPALVRERLWRQAREEILLGDVEVFYLPDDPGKHLLIEYNRDPAIRARREQASYRGPTTQP